MKLFSKTVETIATGEQADLDLLDQNMATRLPGTATVFK
jgi:hypothetical protein